MRLRDIQHQFHETLDKLYDREEVDSFFYILTDEFLGVQRLQLALDPQMTLSEKDAERFMDALEALKVEKPIQYIVGKSHFYGLPFYVDQNTLIPRPETEELVSFVFQSSKFKSESDQPIQILDIGTGSGCIAIALAKHAEIAEITALDISPEALKVAHKNANLNSVDIKFLEADILKPSDGKTVPIVIGNGNSKFDIIVSNPPYVRHLEKAEMKKNVLDYEPESALFVDDDNPLVFYKAIIDFSKQFLKKEGELFFEINQYMSQQMFELLEESGFVDIELRTDGFGNDRMIKATKT